MKPLGENQPLSGSTVLVAAADHQGSKLASTLAHQGARILTLPSPQLTEPESYEALDEAIENLYGYDWLIFIKVDSVMFFLQRLRLLGHEVGQLDSLRVCAIGETTAIALDQAQVHVDVVAMQTNASTVIEQLITYSGGSLDRLNFLIPQAAIGRDYLKEDIESTGARADVITAYQTVASEDLTRLSGLQSMLLTGSVDGIVFTTRREVHDFARVFDTRDLSALIRHTIVLTVDDDTGSAARAAGILQPVQLHPPLPNAITELFAQRLGD